jgi:hypothetical protein
LNHDDPVRLQATLGDRPTGIPVILESTFGWEWRCDELENAGLEPVLVSSSKVAAWRKARGSTKSNRMEADLLSELDFQADRWWAIFDRYTDGGKRNRNRGYIAVAHALCTTAYAMIKKDMDYSNDPRARPGSTNQRSAGKTRKRRRRTPRDSRPGTGQPDTGLVVAG